MKLIHILIASALAATPVAASAQSAPAALAPDSVQEAVATLVVSNFQAGMSQMFAELRSMGVNIDSAQVAGQVIARLGEPYSQAAHQGAAQALSRAVDAASRNAESAYLAEAAALPGVTALPSGVLMRTDAPGTGASPVPTDNIVFHYRGSLSDGSVFDESFSGEPLTGLASAMVPGLVEALQHMNAGGKYTVWLPSALAYGPRGASGVIPPNAPLKFEIELLEIK